MKRNPNNYGCVTKLSGNRSRPFVVKVTISGHQHPIAYAKTREEANIILASYNNNPWDIDRENVTLEVLFERWEKIKMPFLGKSNQGLLKAAYKHLRKYYKYKYYKLKSYHMQDTIDNCPLSPSTKNAIKTLWYHLDRFAFEMDIINKMYSQLTTAPAILETKKEPFTKEQIKALWNIKDKPYVDTVLILMYTGMRINELLTLKADNIDLINKTITGGSKTSAGKGRIIPIHPRIFDFVKLLTENGKSYLVPDKNNKKMTPQIYYHHWKNVMTQIGAENKTPHECRHTFRSLLDSAKANKRCIDMLMGHKTGDVGERIYTHKTLNELRETIDLLQ